MDRQLTRSIAIVAVITLVGGLVMRGCARRMERRIAATPRLRESASLPMDSTRAAALAIATYRADFLVRGDSVGTVLVTAYSTDAASFQFELAPREGRGGRAAVRVDRSGQVELRHIAP